MTTAELSVALAKECPNGVSFNPMAVRLLRQKLPVEDWQIEDLKAAMFQLGNGLWFSREMISDFESRLAFQGKAMEWLKEHGCFSVERLFEDFRGVLRHIDTPQVCAAFLRHLGFTVAAWEKGGYFCYQLSPGLDDSLAAISETIAGRLEEADGTLTFLEIEQAMPHLSAEALKSIRVHFLPEVHEVEVGGVSCWRSSDAISLPEDFSEKVTTIVDTLVALDEKVSAAKLEFALNLFYRIRLREEYALLDNDIFMRICAKHYLGGHDIFSNTKKPRVNANGSSVPGRRVRSPNTRFSTLGVPVGSELIFTKDPHISCVVLDDFNQVEYAGKAWAISTLAMNLLGVSSANGFCHFSYEGETLWDRRSRLEREDKLDEYQAEEMPPPAELQEAEGKIIGLEAQTLSPSTWRALRSAGTNPRVAEWALRVAEGESEQTIAQESGLTVSTVKQYIHNCIRYFDICEKNGITPEGGAADNHDEYQETEMPPPAEAKEAKGVIIGLEGRPLSPSTWRAFRGAGTNPRVAEWVRRVGNGESVENIASESGLTVPTVKEYIKNRRRYLDVCERNGIEPEGGVADNHEEHQAVEMLPPAKVKEEENAVIGTDGRPLSPSTWRLFRMNGTSPRVAEWARRIEDGESVENIASESGLSVSTVKQYIINRNRYFVICEKNGIVPEAGADV
jgi:DNA-binding NarL/FixJ family response regulator